jgi:hypothetical protein
LIIAMDNDKQAIGAPFNLGGYGMANDLLWNAIPIKWAIRAGKSKDGIDFSTEATRVLPTAVAAATLAFRGGQVAVYELTQDTLIDIRHEITQRRKIGVLDDGGNAAIHQAILDEAGFVQGVHYEVILAGTLLTVNKDSCFTSVSEPHFDSTTADEQTEAVRDYLVSGGNYLGQCAAILTYENNATWGLFQTTAGVFEDNRAESFVYLNGDLAFNQFQGDLEDTGGSVRDFGLLAGSVLRARSHVLVQDTPTTTTYAATGTKVNAAGLGSLAFYLGGHNYKEATLASANGRRMYLNSVMIPSVRPPDCGHVFIAQPPVLRTVSGTVLEDINGGADQGDVWAEQTYGDDPTTVAFDLGARVRQPAQGLPERPALGDPEGLQRRFGLQLYRFLGRLLLDRRLLGARLVLPAAGPLLIRGWLR